MVFSLRTNVRPDEDGKPGFQQSQQSSEIQVAQPGGAKGKFVGKTMDFYV